MLSLADQRSVRVTYTLVYRYACCMSTVIHTMHVFSSLQPCHHRTDSAYRMQPNSMLPAHHCAFQLKGRRRIRNRKRRHVPADERHPEQRPAAKRPRQTAGAPNCHVRQSSNRRARVKDDVHDKKASMSSQLPAFRNDETTRSNCSRAEKKAAASP